MGCYVSAYPLDVDDACDAFIALILKHRTERRRALVNQKGKEVHEGLLLPALQQPISKLESLLQQSSNLQHRLLKLDVDTNEEEEAWKLSVCLSTWKRLRLDCPPAYLLRAITLNDLAFPYGARKLRQNSRVSSSSIKILFSTPSLWGIVANKRPGCFCFTLKCLFEPDFARPVRGARDKANGSGKHDANVSNNEATPTTKMLRMALIVSWMKSVD